MRWADHPRAQRCTVWGCDRYIGELVVCSLSCGCDVCRFSGSDGPAGRMKRDPSQENAAENRAENVERWEGDEASVELMSSFMFRVSV